MIGLRAKSTRQPYRRAGIGFERNWAAITPTSEQMTILIADPDVFMEFGSDEGGWQPVTAALIADGAITLVAADEAPVVQVPVDPAPVDPAPVDPVPAPVDPVPAPVDPAPATETKPASGRKTTK